MSQGKKAAACKKLVQWMTLRQEGNRTADKAEANGFPYGVRLTDVNKRIPALIWCMENTQDTYTFLPSITEHDGMGTRFFFANQTDASAFRLCWG